MRPQPIRWIHLSLAAVLAAPAPLAVAENPLVDTRRSSTSTNITQEQLDALPTSRTYRDVINLAAPSKENPKDSINWEALRGDRADQPIPGGVSMDAIQQSPVIYQREWPGEAMGMNGPIIVEGKIGKQDAVGVYSPTGAPVYFATLKEVKADPAPLQQAIQDAYGMGGGFLPDAGAAPAGAAAAKPPKGTASGSTKDADGNTVTYQHPPGGLTTKIVTSPDGTQLSKDTVEPPPVTKPKPREGGDSASATDANGNTITVRTMPDGTKVKTVTDPNGRVIDSGPIEPPPVSKPKPREGGDSASATDANGNTVTVQTQPDGTKVKKVTAPDGTVLVNEPVTPPPVTKPKPKSGISSASVVREDGTIETIELHKDGTRVHTVTDANGRLLSADPLLPVEQAHDAKARQAHHVHGTRQEHPVHGQSPAVSDAPVESVLEDLAPNPVAPLHPQPQGEPKTQITGDGTLVRTFPDGATESTSPEGGQFIRFADDATYQRFPDGTAVDRGADGAETHRDTAGTVTKKTGPTVVTLGEDRPVSLPNTAKTQPQTTPQAQDSDKPFTPIIQAGYDLEGAMQAYEARQQGKPKTTVTDGEFGAWANGLDPLQRQTLNQYLTPKGQEVVHGSGAAPAGGQPAPKLDFTVQGTYQFRGLLTHDTAKDAQPDPDLDGRWNVGAGVQFWDATKNLKLGMEVQYQYLDAFLFDKPSAVGKTPTGSTNGHGAVNTPFGEYDFNRIDRTWGMGLFGQDGLRQNWGLQGADDKRAETVNRVGFVEQSGTTYVVPVFEFKPQTPIPGINTPYLVAPLYKTGKDEAMLLHPSGHLTPGQTVIDPKALGGIDWSKVSPGLSYNFTPRFAGLDSLSLPRDFKAMESLLNDAGWVDRDKDGVREACPAVSGVVTDQDFGRFVNGLDPAIRQTLDGFLTNDGKKAAQQAAGSGFPVNDQWRLTDKWQYNFGGMQQLDPPTIALDLPAGTPPAALDYGMGSKWGLGYGLTPKLDMKLNYTYDYHAATAPIESVLDDIGPESYRPDSGFHYIPGTDTVVKTGGGSSVYGSGSVYGSSYGKMERGWSKRGGQPLYLPGYGKMEQRPAILRPLRFGSHYYGKDEHALYEGYGKGIPMNLTRYGVTFMEPPTLWQPNTIHIVEYGLPDEEGYRDIADLALTIQNGRWEMTITYYVEDLIYYTTKGLPPNDPLYFKGDEAAAKAARKAKEEKRPKPDMSLAAPLGMEGENPAILKKKEKTIKAIDQWGLRAVGFTPDKDSAWRIASGEKPNTVVAVIDSGLDAGHPDAPAHLWVNPDETPGDGIDNDANGYVDDIHGWNFVDDSADLSDSWGHGTLVAGIIAAKRDNGAGIAGINSGAQLMVLKAVNDQGRADSLSLYRAIHYAANNGARVINLSLGDQGRSRLVQLAVNFAHLRGAVVVVAAGNENTDIGAYGPAGLRRVLTVGGLGFEGQRHALSNFGANTALLAPGEDIYSLHARQADWNGPAGDRERLYRPVTGTSFAAPIVAATASLMFAADPTQNNREVEARLLATAKDLDQPGWDPMTGYGLLDAKAALSGDAARAVVVLPTEVLISRTGKKKINAVDVYGVVVAASYEVSVGEGRNPSAWTPIARGDRPIRFGLIGRVDGERFKGAKEWTIRITATGADGTQRIAVVPVSL